MKIIHLDKDFLIVEKTSGIVVHPDQHHLEGTVLDFVKDKLHFDNYDLNQGIVHRLDKPVSGLILIARNLQSWQFFKTEMKKHNIVRKYYALVKGRVQLDQFKVNVPLLKPGKNARAQPAITGAEAITYFQVLKRWANKTLLECKLETGRTHQIRAHLKFIKHPILNDPLYYQGKSNSIFLYAYFLTFDHPKSKKKLKFKMKIPDFFIFADKFANNKQ